MQRKRNSHPWVQKEWRIRSKLMMMPNRLMQPQTISTLLSHKVQNIMISLMTSLPTKSTQPMLVVHGRRGELVLSWTSSKLTGVTLLRQSLTRRSTRPTSGRTRKWEPPWSNEGLHERGSLQKPKSIRENRWKIGVVSMLLSKRSKR